MASFKVMHSSNSSSSSSSIRPQQFRRDPNADQSMIRGGYVGRNDGFSSNTMTVEGILHDTFASDPPATDSTLLDASITLIDSPATMEITTVSDVDRSSRDRTNGGGSEMRGKSVDEVWRQIVSGEGKGMKEETHEEIMTLEDFLAKAAVEDAATVGNGGEESDDLDVKIPPDRLNYGVGGDYGFDHSAPPYNPFQMFDKVEGSIVAFGNGLDVYRGAKGKRARAMVEPLDKAAAQRQRRMIKNRESAARSRERKQAYQIDLESLAAKLEKENEMLSKEIEEKRKERYQKLMEPQQPLSLRRIRSSEW